MTIVLWKVLDDPAVPPTLRWGFRAANVALDCEPSALGRDSHKPTH